MNHYIIGESPPERLNEAVDLELTHSIYPTVSETKTTLNNHRDKAMKKFTELIIQDCVKAKQLGTADCTNEGCKADMIYYEGDNNQCLQIQVRVTARSIQRRGNTTCDTWIFRQDDYSGQLIIFRSIEDGKAWMIPYDLLVTKYRGQRLKIYESPNALLDWRQFSVNNNDLADKLHEYYSNPQSLQLIDKFMVNQHIHHSQQTKSSHMDHIIGVLNPIDRSIIQWSKYNLVLDGIRLLDKVAGEFGSNSGYKVVMSHSLKRVCYQHTDFDALIIHPPNIESEIFYCIPIPVLVERGIVESPNSTGKKTITVYPDEVLSRINRKVDIWANQYIFRYDTPNLRFVLIEFIRRHLA